MDLRNEVNFEFHGNYNEMSTFEIAGHVTNYLQLVLTLQYSLEVSPLDVFAVIPHPISLFTVLGEIYMDNYVENEAETTWEIFPGFSLIKDWNTEHKGQDGLPNEYLYLTYTDQNNKYNPEVMPTSIVFLNMNDAERVFGFVPLYINCDKESRIFNNSGIINFKPTKQVTLSN